MARPVKLSSNALLKTKLPAWRSRFALGVLAFGFLALSARAVYLQAWTTDYLQRQGAVRVERTLEVPATRGKIVDRTGAVLATSLPAKAVWAIPDDVDAPREQLVQLAKLLEMDRQELERKLAEDKSFVYVKRQVDAAVAERIAALGIPGIHLRNEYKRHYPEGEATAHVVGFTNVEDVGQEGFELSQQQRLAGKPGSRRVMSDNLGRVIEQKGSGIEPRDGQDLSLSIDTRIQYLTLVGAARHRARAPRARGRRGGRRRAHRRGARAVELADLQPQQPPAADRRAAAQPRAHRHVRARLDDEAVHGRAGAGARQGQADQHDRHRARAADDRAGTRSTTRTPTGR